MIEALIGGILALIGTGISVAVASRNKQEELNTTQSLNAENIAMTREENAINRDREDNYLQRRVADATAAGLSPLSVADNQPAAATVSVPQNNFVPNIGQYGVGMAQALQDGFGSAGDKIFDYGQNKERNSLEREKISSAEKQLADTLANSKSIAEKQEATKRFCAQLGADTQTQNTLAEIASSEKLNGYNNAAKVAGGIAWLASAEGQSVVDYDPSTQKRSVTYAKVDEYKRDANDQFLKFNNYDIAYYIQARAYMDDKSVPLKARAKWMIDFEFGRHPNVPYQYTFKN